MYLAALALDASNPVVAANTLTFFLLMALLTIWNKHISWFLGAAAGVLFYIISLTILFNQQYYSEFLKTVGYGGAIPMVVEFTHKKESLDINLKLRTTKYLVGTNSEGMIVEIPLQGVSNIVYRSSP